MYTLWISVPNEHFSKRASKVVSNDSYKQAGQFNTLEQANLAMVKALTSSAPGTKVKLIGTVPYPVTPAEETIAQLKAKIAQLEGRAA